MSDAGPEHEGSLLPVPSRVVRDVVIHMTNEQPLIADLFGLPTATDTAIVCTNLRTLGGKRPVFVDAGDSVFVFPLMHIRFVEIPAASSGRVGVGEGAERGAARPLEEPELEIDESFLRRVRDA